MSLEGMDVDQLRGLTRQIDRDAQALSRVINTITGIMGQLALLWQGAVADAFEQDWQFKNRPALQSAYNTLTDLRTHLVNNINQQASASAAEGGWAAGGVSVNQQSAGAAGGGWTAERVVGDFENALKGEDLVDKGLKLSGAAEFVDHTPVGHVLPVLSLVSMGLGAYHVGKDAYAVNGDMAEGQYGKAANDYVDGVSETLKAVSGPIMVADPLVGLAVYGAGVDLKLVDEAVNLDWKDTPNPLNGNNWEKIYEPEFRSMTTAGYWEQAGRTLWGAL